MQDMEQTVSNLKANNESKCNYLISDFAADKLFYYIHLLISSEN